MLEMSERESSDVWRNQQPAHKAPVRVDAKEPRSRKSVYRSNSGTLTGGLTIFSRSRCIASETRRTRDIQQKTSTGRV